MKTVGLIVEYNPLHNGHVYHFQQSKIVSGADACVCVMSGNFLQRGEPALVDKWARAEMALKMGADLVIELPVAYSSQPAEWFAFGAVSALHATGIVDFLCFGSESGDIGRLDALADHLHREPDLLQQLIRLELKKGTNYPSAYSRAVERYIGDGLERAELAPDELSRPNNILGLHYLIALKRLGSAIAPLTIKRRKAEYDQADITDSRIASATAIRKLLTGNRNLAEAAPYVPSFTYAILEREWLAGRAPVTWEQFAGPLLHQLISRTPEQLAEIYEVAEGLERRIKRLLPELRAKEAASVEHLLRLAKTKRYTWTKLQRTFVRILLNHSKAELRADCLRQGVPYLRILGFSDTGRLLLRRMKKTANVPVVTKVTTCSSPFLDMDIRASSVYATGFPVSRPDLMFRDYYEAPIQLGGKAAPASHDDLGASD